MSEGNKTELPTPKKLENARKEGNFLFSEALVTWVVLFFGISVCYLALADLGARFDRSLQAAIHLGQLRDFNVAVQNFAVILFSEMMPPTALVMGTVILFAIIGNVSQVGFVFSGVKIRKGLQFEQGLNPVANAKNLFSKHTLARFIFSTIKVSLLLWFTYHWIASDPRFVDQFWGGRTDALLGLAQIGELVGKVALYALLLTLPVCLIDWGVVWFFYRNDNMMSHDEVMKEQKESEGDPHMKSARKQLAHELIMEPNRLPSASAVIRNPNHIAVVVRYEPATSPMPYIMDMQTDEMALNIVREAERLGVPTIENIPFARSLFEHGKVNEHIPLLLSEQAVSFIYWLQHNHPERIYHHSEFSETLTRIGDVRR